MESPSDFAVPAGHTSDGGVLVGSEGARRSLVLFEDPQCPYCRQFEEVSGDLLRREIAAGAVRVEYRMRCFLGEESVRADNALALAAEAGHFDQFRRELFANQPPEQSGGFSPADLIELGLRAGLSESGFQDGVTDGRYEAWVIATDRVFQTQDPQGTPAGILDGKPVASKALFDPAALGALIRG
jgi:protein-disulfide isomerase